MNRSSSIIPHVLHLKLRDWAALLVLLCMISTESFSQVGLSLSCTGYAAIRQNELLSLESGIAPGIGLKWNYAKRISGALEVQTIFWRNRNDYVQDVHSSFFELLTGYQFLFKENSLTFNSGLGYVINAVDFIEKNQSFITDYRGDFYWNNLSMVVMSQFKHSSGFLASIGYRRFLGIDPLPNYDSSFIQLSFGYSCNLTKILSNLNRNE